MAPRRSIIAGEAVIVIRARDTVDSVFSSIKTKANKLAYDLGNIGQGLSLTGLLGTAGLIGVAKQFTSFEDSILFLQTKLEDSADVVDHLILKIRDLGRTTSFTAREVAEGAVVLGQAGFSSQEIENSLQAVLDLARASRVEFETAGRILANLVRTFEIPTENASKVADQLVLGARKGTLGLVDLGESLKEVAGTARSLNIDLPTIVNLLTQMSFASLRGTKAGTSLNTALLQIANKADVIRNLGVFLPNEVNSQSILQFFQDLSDRLEKVNNLSRTAILQQLFNIRGGRAANALFLRLKELPKLENQLRGVSDEARRAAETMDSKLGGAFRIAKSAVEDFGITLGLIVGGPLTDLLRLVPPVIDQLDSLAKANPKVVLALAALPPIMLATGLGLIGLSFGLARLSGLIGTIRPLVAAVGKGIGSVLGSAMITASIATNTLFNSLTRVDRRLSAIFLTPQLRGGRGRNARKIVPTSFFGRIGNTELRPLIRARDIISDINDVFEASFTGVAGRSGPTRASAFGIRVYNAFTNGFQTAFRAARFNPFDIILRDSARSLRRANLITTLTAQIRGQAARLATLRTNTFTPRALPQNFLNRIIGNNAAIATTSRRIASVSNEVGRLNQVISSARPANITAGLARLDRLEAVSARIEARNVTNLRRRANFEASLQQITRDRFTTINAISVAEDAANKGSVAARARQLAAQRELEILNHRRFRIQQEIAKLPIRQVLITPEEANRQRLALQAQAATRNPRVEAARIRRDVLAAERVTLQAELAAQQRTAATLATRRTRFETIRHAVAHRASLRNAQQAIRTEDLVANTAARLRRVQRTPRNFINFNAIVAAAGRVSSLLTRTLGNTFLGLSRLLTSGIGRGLRTIASTNFIGGLARTGLGLLRTIGGLIRGFGSLLAVSFRTVTTLSGWGNILSILILIGPEIKFIRDAFARLATGLGETFSILGSIFTGAAGPLKLFSQGIVDLTQGKTKTGFAAIRVAFEGIVGIISGRLQQAWGRFVLTLAPALNYIRNIFGTILETITLVIRSAGSLIAAIAKSFNIKFDLSLGGGDVGVAFAGVAAFLKTSASIITTGIGKMVETVIGVMGILRKGIGRFIQDFATFSGGSIASTLGFGKTSVEVEAIRAYGLAVEAAGNAQLLFSGQIPGFFEEAKKNANDAFEVFKTNLKNLFAKDFAVGAQTNINAGLALAEGAIDRVANLLALRAASDGSIFNTIGNFFSSGGFTKAIVDGFKAAFAFNKQNPLPAQQGGLLDLFKGAIAAAQADTKGLAAANAQFIQDSIRSINQELKDTDLRDLEGRIQNLANNPAANAAERFVQQRKFADLIARRDALLDDPNLVGRRAQLAREKDALLRLGRQQRIPKVGPIQATIRDIMGTVVGDIKSARANNVLALNDKSDSKLLENIVANTGGTQAGIQDLIRRTGPLVLQ